MITRIYANDKRFKPVKFEKGLNVILADRKQDSNEKDSRNGIGKTTLINILHFCLGSDLNRKILPVDEIEGWIFFLDMELCGNEITACRNIDNAGIIGIKGDTTGFPIKPETDEKKGIVFYKLADWRELLGSCLFGIKQTIREKYNPSFRTLISYFIRVGLDAYSKPFLYFRNQKSWQTQVANAFLLGLNWEHASDVQILKDKNNAAKALDDAVKNSIVHSKGELEADRIRLQREVEVEDQFLSSFKVHPKYYEFQITADSLTKDIQALSNRNLMLQRKLSRYEESIHSEKDPDSTSVTDLYEEAGLHFGDLLKKSLEDTKSFHSQIIQNRKNFLAAEISEIKNSLSSNTKIIEEKSSERAELMKLLQAHGALDEFTFLQNASIEKRTKLEGLKEKIADMQSMAIKKKEIKAERIEVDSKIQRDYEEARPAWEKAIYGFNENSLALYNNPGNLIINTSEKGIVKDNAYSFDVEIPRSNSEGVGKMKIFCYDLMLVSLFSKERKIDFLVHDSTMFDGVDSRQVAHALEYAHKKAIDTGFQYICAFNSDGIPNEDFSEGFDIQKYVRLRLSDQRPEDSLLGFHFELAKKQAHNDVEN
tara:strand:+ start:30539 stop:32323 length:1785 start_codon:yes stop_codon:yes gene_type:complete